MTKRERIEKHMGQLAAIFPALAESIAQGGGAYKATYYERLRSIEARGGRLAERECSEPEPSPGFYDRAGERLMVELDRLLGFKAAGVPVFLNGDPRGYALKINDEYVRAKGLEIEKDWGGYGIIAPEF